MKKPLYIGPSLKNNGLETHYLVQHVDDQEWDGHYKVSETILRP